MEGPKDDKIEDPKEKVEEEKVSEDQKEKEPYIEGELIYNEEKGNQDMENYSMMKKVLNMIHTK